MIQQVIIPMRSDELLIIALLLVLAVTFVAALIVLRAIRAMVRLTMPGVLENERAERVQAKAARKASMGRWWRKLMGLRPLSEEPDLVIDHAYDGITELDNPVPAWFNGLFYASVAFAVVYLCVYHVFGWGLNQREEYAEEMARAEKARQAWLAQAANNIDENSVTVDLSPATLSAGQAIFAQNCAACHGQVGEGGIGPNLTDAYWLHGGEVDEIFKTVKYGVIDKGMVPWEQNLTPAQIAEVSNYIVSLRGTNPPNAKGPQGREVHYLGDAGDEQELSDAESGE